MPYEFSESPHDPEIDKFLEDCTVQAFSAETTSADWDLGTITCQRAVLEALNLEGMDVGYLADSLNKSPDGYCSTLIAGYVSALYSLRDSASVSAETRANLIPFIQTQHRLAWTTEQVIIARRSIDNGVDPSEVKTVTQLEIYVDKRLTTEEKAIWLRVVDRIIPEVGGLDPNSPNTALEIERWAQQYE